MKKYRLELKSGFTRWAQRTVYGKDSYDSVEDIPVFDADEHPITPGLNRLENSGKLKIVEVTEDENTKEDEDESTEKVEADSKEASEQENETEVDNDDGESEEEQTPERETEEGETELPEGNDSDITEKEPAITEDELVITREELDAMTVNELDDLAREEGITGYSGLRKDEKVDLLFKELN